MAFDRYRDALARRPDLCGETVRATRSHHAGAAAPGPSRSPGPRDKFEDIAPLQPRIGDAQKSPLRPANLPSPDGPRQSVHDQSGLTAELEEPAIGFQGILARCRVDTASQEHDLAAGIEGRGCITQLDALAIAGAMGERLGLGSLLPRAPS